MNATDNGSAPEPALIGPIPGQLPPMLTELV